MIKGKNHIILFFIISILSLYGIIYVIPKITGVLTPSYIAQYGELQIFDQVDGYIVRDEKIYFAGKSGEVNRYIKEGKLIRKGTKILNLSGDYDGSQKFAFRDIREASEKSGITTNDFVVKEEGLIYYKADGFESEFTPKNMYKKNSADFRKLSRSNNRDLNIKTVAKGDPVFKLIDRSAWYIVCYIKEKNEDRYSKGSKYPIAIDGKTNIYGRVIDKKKQDGKIRLIIKTDYNYEYFAEKRNINIKILTADASGLIIYNESIKKENGKEGVYIKKHNGKHQFLPIQVISTDGEKSVITNSYFYDKKGQAIATVQNYDEVLR